MSTLRVSNIEAKADPSSPSIDEKLKVTNSNGDVLVQIDGKTVGVTTVGINTTDKSFAIDNNQNVEFLGIVTATKFSLSGGGEITGGDGNFTGIVTASSLNVTGNVSIAGTLTYEDVTSIDSVGIITAQSDVIVGAGLSVVGISTLANTNINGQLTATNARITGVTTFGTSSTTINGAHEYPSIRPTLDLNFAATKTLDRRITFTRDGVGTYVDELGIVRTVSNNVPRFDHDPTTGESLGLLIEESRTNLCINSTSSSNWGTPFQLTKDASKTITAPSGDIDAYEWTETTDSTTHLNNGPSISISSGSSYSISAFLKRTAGTLDRGYFIQWYKSGGQAVKVSYVPSTDTIYISNSGGASAPTNVSVVTYPNGWYKISFTAALAETSALAIVGVTDSSGSTSFTGDTSMKHSFWGLQYELGSFPTSYIPTSGSTVTRAADIAKITGTNFSDFYNQTEGTVFSSHQQYSGQSDTQNTYVYQIANANSSSVAFRLIDKNTYYSNPARLTATQWSNDVALQKPDATNGERIRTAFACKVNDAAVSYDGATVLTDTSLDMNSDQTIMSIGCFPHTPQAFLNGHIQQISYYNKRLTNAQLQGLTQQ